MHKNERGPAVRARQGIVAFREEFDRLMRSSQRFLLVAEDRLRPGEVGPDAGIPGLVGQQGAQFGRHRFQPRPRGREVAGNCQHNRALPLCKPALPYHLAPFVGKQSLATLATWS